MKIKKFAAAGLLAISILATGCGKAQIGYVDGSRVMEEAPQIKKVIEEGTKKAEDIQIAAEEELSKKTDLTPEERAKAYQDVERKIAGINQAYSTQLKQKLDAALFDISNQKNLDVVVDSSKDQPIIFMGGIDVTEDVIKKLQ